MENTEEMGKRHERLFMKGVKQLDKRFYGTRLASSRKLLQYLNAAEQETLLSLISKMLTKDGRSCEARSADPWHSGFRRLLVGRELGSRYTILRGEDVS